MFPYRPNPVHILLPVLVLIASAVITGLFPSWQMGVAFGVIAVLCLATGIWIAWADLIERYSSYWENIGKDIDKLQKTPPELWGTLGFIKPPRTVKLHSEVTGENGESDIYAMKLFTLDISPERMQVIADGLLSGVKSLAESDWKDTIIGTAKMREIKHEMLRAELIRLRNPRNTLSGFMLTQKGIRYLWEYASDYLKEELDLFRLLADANHPPSEVMDTPKIVSP